MSRDPSAVAQVMGMPEPRMREVLDASGGTPLETLAPRQTRETPSVGDAVMGVRAGRGQGPPVELVGAAELRVIPGPSPEGTLARI